MEFKQQVLILNFLVLFIVSAKSELFQNKSNGCNLFNGDWVYEASAEPLYDSSSCPFIDSGFDCLKFARPDKQYLKYSWKPTECTLPKFDGVDFLRRWKGKKIMFVGDSLSLNQWNSLACMLHAADPNAKTDFVRKSDSSYITFQDYGVTIHLYTTHFLVDVVHEAIGNVLKLDSIKQGKFWKGMDMLIFNTWHWWGHAHENQGWDFIQYGSTITKDMNRLDAFAAALATWAQWVDQNVDPFKTKVFYQESHQLIIKWGSKSTCVGEQQPIKGPSSTVKMPEAAKIVSKVLRTLRKPVYLLDVTALSQLRKDGHPSKYSRIHANDCGHWCIPGVPDTWNQLLYAALV